jgi:hypothetical protein
MQASLDWGTQDPVLATQIETWRNQLHTPTGTYVLIDTSYETISSQFTADAGLAWFLEWRMLGGVIVDDPPNDATRLRLTAPAGGRWMGVIMATEDPSNASTTAMQFFDLSDGATLVMTVGWTTAGGDMPVLIWSMVSGTTTGGNAKIEASHATNARTTQTQIYSATEKQWLVGERVLG